MSGAQGGVPMTNAQAALLASALRAVRGGYDPEEVTTVAIVYLDWLAWADRQDTAAGRGEVQDT